MRAVAAAAAAVGPRVAIAGDGARGAVAAFSPPAAALWAVGETYASAARPSCWHSQRAPRVSGACWRCVSGRPQPVRHHRRRSTPQAHPPLLRQGRSQSRQSRRAEVATPHVAAHHQCRSLRQPPRPLRQRVAHGREPNQPRSVAPPPIATPRWRRCASSHRESTRRAHHRCRRRRRARRRRQRPPRRHMRRAQPRPHRLRRRHGSMRIVGWAHSLVRAPPSTA